VFRCLDEDDDNILHFEVHTIYLSHCFSTVRDNATYYDITIVGISVCCSIVLVTIIVVRVQKVRTKQLCEVIIRLPVRQDPEVCCGCVPLHHGS